VSYCGVSARAVAIVATLVAVACDVPTTTSSNLPTKNPQLSTEVVSGGSISIGVGATKQLTTSLTAWEPQSAVGWSSSNNQIANVNASGVVTGIAVGTATVTAKKYKKTDTFQITVTSGSPPGPTPVATITVSAVSTSVPVGQTTQANAVAKDSSGASIPGVSFTWSSSDPATASVNTTGLVTGVATGSVSIIASAGGQSGTLAINVTAPPPSPPSGGLASLPAPPNILLNFPYAPATGRTINVRAGDDLQAAISSAQRGDEIVVQAGATFVGNFTLTAKSGTPAGGWITIRSDKLSQLPPQGTRVTAAHASLMPRIVTPNTAPAFRTATSASGWRLVGLDISVSASFTMMNYGLIFFGDATQRQNTIAAVPTDLVLDRVYVHGHPTSKLQRCIALNSARTAIQDSYIKECHAKTIDSQAIAGWNGPGPFKIVNNTIEGAGENLLFGGGSPTITNLIPSDIEIRRNYFHTPSSWKGKWVKMNLFELKAARRVIVEGNIFDGSWADAQNGWALIIKTSNQTGSCTWCTTSDVTLRNNIIRNTGAGIDIAGKEGTNVKPIGARVARVLVENNQIERVNLTPYNGDGRAIILLENASDVIIRSNTIDPQGGSMNSFLSMGTYPAATRLEFIGNATYRGTWGMAATGLGTGLAALGAIAGGWRFSTDYIVSTPFLGYPLGAIFVSTLTQALNAGGGADAAKIQQATAGVAIP
jgi:hypothetical protein